MRVALHARLVVHPPHLNATSLINAFITFFRRRVPRFS